MTKRTDGPTLLVLAAGMGSRYGGLKQLAPVNPSGEAILDYSVFDAMRAGFQRVVFVIRREIEDVFRSHVAARFEGRVDVRFVFQELGSLPFGFAPPAGRVKPWGTLHATLLGAEDIEGPFAVINADDFYGADSYQVLAAHLPRDGGSNAMVGFTLRNTLSEFGPVSRGICTVSADSLLLHTVERTRIVRDGAEASALQEDGSSLHLTGDEVASMNMWGFQPSIVAGLRQAFAGFLERSATDLKAESYLPAAVNRLVTSGEACVRVLATADRWCGITYPEDYEPVIEFLRRLTAEGKYPERLWAQC